MIHKFHLQLLIVLVIFSYVLSSSVVSPTRKVLSHPEKATIQAKLVQGDVEFRNGEDMIDTGEEITVKERMNLEGTDYRGTGANNRHDPKTPGGA